MWGALQSQISGDSTENSMFTSGRHDASSPSIQFAVATKYGEHSDNEYNGSTLFLSKVLVYSGFLSIKNCKN